MVFSILAGWIGDSNSLIRRREYDFHCGGFVVVATKVGVEGIRNALCSYV